jgi:hypothetical protein
MVGAIGEPHAVSVLSGPRRPDSAKATRCATSPGWWTASPVKRGEMRALTEKNMFAILDHECRDRHLWTLALYGLRGGEIAGVDP